MHGMTEGPSFAEFMAGWELGLYQAPVLAGLIAGIVLGYLGVFVVLRRTVFITATLSQAAGMGVALSFFAGIHWGITVPPMVGALFASLFATLVFSVPAEKLKLTREALLGLAYIGCWTGAVLVGDAITQEAHDIAGILFGTAVLVRDEDLYALLGVAVLVLTLKGLGHRGFAFATFDPEGARVQGLPVRMLNGVSWVLIALAIGVATRALGVLPVFAFAVLPAMTGLMLSDRLSIALAIAATVGGLSGAAGYVVAFFAELPVGASQAACTVVLFLLVMPLRLLRPARA